MEKLQTQAYLFGIPKIDAQHMKFFQLSRSIHEYIETNQESFNPRELLVLLLQFRKYAFNHFYTEESMMLDKKYPGFFDQKEAHNSFLMAVIEYEEKVEKAYHDACEKMKAKPEAEGESADSATTEDGADMLGLADELCTFVTDWYAKHILEMDKAYVDYLK